MSAAWTIRSLLAWMARDFAALELPTARLDAEIMVAHVLGLDRVHLYMDLDRPLSAAELASVRALVVRRRRREPVAYLTGQREFYRRAFEVSNAVLIPRPDTECLVERALALLPKDATARVLDLCTGSGAIAISLAAERPAIRVDATDLSPEALLVAERNARRHGVSERVTFQQGDLFAALRERHGYDMIVANPPYVRSVDLPTLAPELGHEPELALVAGVSGLDVLDRLCAQAPSWLGTDGVLLFEVGQGQASDVLAALRQDATLGDFVAHVDLGGIERVVEARVQPAKHVHDS
jgi:release factor glutamine methyltransferase